MTSQARQFKSGALYLFATLVDSVVPVITLPVFTRILSVEDYGALALAQVYALFAGGLANCGLNTAYNRNYFQYSHDKIQTGQLFFSTILFVALSSCVFGLPTFWGRELLSAFVIRSPHYGGLLFWSFCGNCLINLRLYFLTYLRNVERPKQYIANTILISGLNLLLSLYFVVALRIGVMGIVFAQVISSSAVLIILLIQLKQELPFGFNRTMLLEELKIGAPLLPMIAFGVVNNHFDKYMVGLLSTVGGVGVYSIGQKIAMLIFTFTTSLQNVFSPRIYKKMFEGKKESAAEIGQYTTPFAYIVALMALLLVLFAEEAVWLLMPPPFYGAIDIIILLSLFYTLLFFGKINGDQLIYAKKTMMTSVIIMGGAVVNVIFNIPFILKWGAVGAAGATLVSRVVTGGIVFKVAQHFYRIDWEYRKLGIIFAILFAAASFLLVLRSLPVPYSLRVILKIVMLGGYGYVGVKIGLIHEMSPFSKRKVP